MINYWLNSSSRDFFWDSWEMMIWQIWACLDNVASPLLWPWIMRGFRSGPTQPQFSCQAVAAIYLGAAVSMCLFHRVFSLFQILILLRKCSVEDSSCVLGVCHWCCKDVVKIRFSWRKPASHLTEWTDHVSAGTTGQLKPGQGQLSVRHSVYSCTVPRTCTAEQYSVVCTLKLDFKKSNSILLGFWCYFSCFRSFKKV